MPTAGDGRLPGHVSITEINWGDYNDKANNKAKKKRIPELNHALAILASKDIIAGFEAVQID